MVIYTRKLGESRIEEPINTNGDGLKFLYTDVLETITAYGFNVAAVFEFKRKNILVKLWPY